MGIGPTTSVLPRLRSATELPRRVSRDRDSDPGPTVYKTVALPLSYLGASQLDDCFCNFTSKTASTFYRLLLFQILSYLRRTIRTISTRFAECWEKDSNLRSLAATVLQTAAFVHSAIPARRIEISLTSIGNRLIAKLILLSQNASVLSWKHIGIIFPFGH